MTTFKPLFNLNLERFPIYTIMLLMGFLFAYIRMNGLLKSGGYSIYIAKKVKKTLVQGAILGLLVANVFNWFLIDGLLDRSIYFRITKGGASFVFGLVTFLLFSAIVLRIRKINVMKVLHLVVQPILIAHILGRIGCSIRGCCWGKDIAIGGNVFCFPAREIEAVFLLCLYWVIKHKVKEKALWVYLCSYSVFRFIIEFFRGDNRGELCGIAILSPSQIICLILVIISVFILFFKDKLNLSAKKESTYVPMPDNYMEPIGTKHPVRMVMRILMIIFVVLTIFVAINPMNLGWCTNIQWKVSSMFSFLFEEASRGEEIGDSSGTSIIPVTYEGTVDLQTGLELVSKIDEWSEAEYVAAYEKSLESGGKAYVYLQSVNGRVVMGSSRILLVDAESENMYIVNDAANQAYTTTQLSVYKESGITLEQAFDKEVVIKETVPCWYDSGRGLVAAKHVVFTCGDDNLAMAALIEESNNGIICFTQPELGALSNGSEKNALEIANVIEKVKKEIKLTDEQIDKIVLSTETVSRIDSSCSIKRYGEIFVSQTECVLRQEGYKDDEIDFICKKIRVCFNKAEDEKSIEINAGTRKKTFEYKINYYLDADVIRLVSQENHKVNLTVESEKPIMVEVYDETGRPLTSVYVTSKEDIVLYPEDGTEFTLRVKGTDTATGAKYKIAVKSTEQKIEIPLAINTALYRIEKYYNTSNSMMFMSMYKLGDSTIMEGMAVGVILPVFESCVSSYVSCIGYPGLDEIPQTDYAKTMILSYLIYEEIGEEMIPFIEDSEMRITYKSHIETEDGYYLRVKVQIVNESLIVYSGYTRMKLQLMEENALPKEIMEIPGVELLFEKQLCITEVNTETLFAAFGDDPTKPSEVSDISTLYAYCESRVDKIGKVSVPIQVFRSEKAVGAGYSKEKIDSFQKGINRINIASYKMERDKLASEISKIRAVKQGYELFSVFTDPTGYFIGAVAEKNEFTDALYTAYGYITDPSDAFKDDIESTTIDFMCSGADELEKTVKMLDERIKELEESMGK